MKSTDRILASRYARAYDALSRDTAQAAAAYEALREATEALSHARAFMQDPAICTAKKQAFVQELFGSNSQVTFFLHTLLSAKRYYLLPACTQEVGALLDERQGVVRAQAQTAFELGPTQQKKVQEAISQFTGKNAQVHFDIDRTLLGGLRVRVGDVLIDGSLKGCFEKLQQELMK